MIMFYHSLNIGNRLGWGSNAHTRLPHTPQSGACRRLPGGLSALDLPVPTPSTPVGPATFPIYVTFAREGGSWLLSLFPKEQLQTQGGKYIQFWSPWSFIGSWYNLLQPAVTVRFICIAKPSCTLLLLLFVLALVGSLSIII